MKLCKVFGNYRIVVVLSRFIGTSVNSIAAAFLILDSSEEKREGDEHEIA